MNIWALLVVVLITSPVSGVTHTETITKDSASKEACVWIAEKFNLVQVNTPLFSATASCVKKADI